MSHASTIQSLLDDGYRLYAQGQQSALLEAGHLKRIRDAIPLANRPTRVELCSWEAAVRLATHNATGAEEALKKAGIPVRENFATHASRSITSDLKPHQAALLHLNLSRLAEQRGKVDAAKEEAYLAVDKSPPMDVPLVDRSPVAVYAGLLGCEVRLHLARISFRRDDGQRAVAMIRGVRSWILQNYPVVDERRRPGDEYAQDAPPNERHGFNVALAAALSLRGHFDWRQGRFEEGRRRAFQAIHLLRPPVRNDLALAMALVTAGRIEAMRSELGPELLLHLHRESQVLWRRYGHPSEWQARMQEALCLVKAKREERAERLLNELERSVEARLASDPTPLLVDVRGDLRLGRIWLSASRQHWKLVGEEAEKLRESPSVRHFIEGTLHLGIALCNAKPDDPSGVRLIEEALEDAEKSSRERIAIRAHLALAEFLKDEKEARRHYSHASAMLTRHRAGGLTEYHSRLAPRFQYTSIDVSLKQSLSEAISQLTERYTEIMFGGDTDIKNIMRLAGVSKATAYRMRDDLKKRKRR